MIALSGADGRVGRRSPVPAPGAPSPGLSVQDRLAQTGQGRQDEKISSGGSA